MELLKLERRSRPRDESGGAQAEPDAPREHARDSCYWTHLHGTRARAALLNRPHRLPAAHWWAH